VRVALGARDRAVMLQVDERAAEGVEVPAKTPGKAAPDAPRRSPAERADAVTEPNGHTVHALINGQHGASCREEQQAVRCGRVELRQQAEGAEHREP